MLNAPDIQQIESKIEQVLPLLNLCLAEMETNIIGQRHLQQRLLIALLCDGHILLEGVPGLAKTMSIKTLADCLHVDFSRVQFTPDLLPADVMGTMVFNMQANRFEVRMGPIFANLVLADEINRAPAKVQSALLEAMQERQVTIGDETHKLPQPFLVMATQNPLEQEGTYQLPEAQLDRFLMKVKISYPSREDEMLILRKASVNNFPKVRQILTNEDLKDMRKLCQGIYLDERIEGYIVDIVQATRNAEESGLSRLAPYISYGASPRASISLAQTSKAIALLNNRAFVIPEDVRAVAHDVLTHRIGISYEGQADDIDSDLIITEVLNTVKVP
ncbi:MAG: AAA family ATPase [Bacteroidota bacterium]|nr:AAA family ATPase [Bacteroidota bacterium]